MRTEDEVKNRLEYVGHRVQEIKRCLIRLPDPIEAAASDPRLATALGYWLSQRRGLLWVLGMLNLPENED